MGCGAAKTGSSSLSRAGTASGARIVFLLAAGVLGGLASTGLHSFVQDPPRDHRVEAQVQEMVGAVAPPFAGRVEAPRSSGFTGSSRSRLDDWSWAVARLNAGAGTIMRLFGACALRQENGRTGDQPLVLTCPARGPPAGA